jgi:hypothetical protein
VQEEGQQRSRETILVAFNKRHLAIAGYSEAQILGLGDLAKLTKDQMHKLIHEKASEAVVADLKRRRVRIRVLPPKKGRRRKKRARLTGTSRE